MPTYTKIMPKPANIMTKTWHKHAKNVCAF